MFVCVCVCTRVSAQKQDLTPVDIEPDQVSDQLANRGIYMLDVIWFYDRIIE